MRNDFQSDFASKKTDSGVEAAYASALQGADQWVQIFPAEKEWYGADGRGPYRMSNPEAIVKASMEAQRLQYARIDREHASMLAQPGTSVPAAGWFKEFAVRDGAIWGRAEWTPRATEELASKEFRFFSAEFVVNKITREIECITGGTLTNSPNFRQMQALATAEKTPSSNQKETDPMKKELIALAKALGLDPEKATEEEILVAAAQSRADLNKLQEDLASIRKALDLKDDARADAIIETAAARKKADSKGGTPDPKEFVPRQMYDELASRMDKFEKTAAQSAAEEVVATAMKDGKITPAMKGWAEGYAQRDMASFKAFLDKQPKIVDAEETAAAKRRESTHGGLTDADIEIAKQLGTDIEDLKKRNTQDKDAA